MLHKCANPTCVNLFRSMHQGKLFVVESEGEEAQAQIQTNGSRKSRAPRRLEHYWLCDKCFPQVTLTFTKGLGLLMVPLLPPQARTPEAKKPMNSLRHNDLLPPATSRLAGNDERRGVA